MIPISSKADQEEIPTSKRSLPEFDYVFHEFERPIYHYLLGVTQNHADAEDLTQETFIRVNDKLKTFRREASLKTWIYRIATNVSIDHFRSRVCRQTNATQSFEEVEFDRESVDNNVPSPDHQVAQSEMSDCVQGFIQRLPLSYRTVLLLHDRQGLKVQDIAVILDCSPDTVKIRLHRARNKLRESLDAGCDLAHDERNELVCERNLSSTTL
jgi:RNA polymerase sigma-70 factor (ECF subfamily)